MSEERFALWWAGKIEDEQLTEAETQWLQEAVFAALQRKYQAPPETSAVQ